MRKNLMFGLLSLAIFMFVVTSCGDDEINNEPQENLYINYKRDGVQVVQEGDLYNVNYGGQSISCSVDGGNTEIILSWGILGLGFDITPEDLESLEGQKLPFGQQGEGEPWADFDMFYEGDFHSAYNASLDGALNSFPSKSMTIESVDFWKESNLFGETERYYFVKGIFNCVVGTDFENYTVTDGRFNVVMIIELD
jgi:hypothetical protein